MGQGAAHGGVLCGPCGWRGPRAEVDGCASGPHRVGAPHGGRGGTGVRAGRAGGDGSGDGGGRGAGSAACGSTGRDGRAERPLQAPGGAGGVGLVGVGGAGAGLGVGAPEEGASLSYSQIWSPGGRRS